MVIQEESSTGSDGLSFLMRQVAALTWASAWARCGSGLGGRAWKEEVFRQSFAAHASWSALFADADIVKRDSLIDGERNVDFNIFKCGFQDAAQDRSRLMEAYKKVIRQFTRALHSLIVIQFGPIVLVDRVWDVCGIRNRVSKSFWTTASYVYEHLPCEPNGDGGLRRVHHSPRVLHCKFARVVASELGGSTCLARLLSVMRTVILE
jgi:hypothetical protein